MLKKNNSKLNFNDLQNSEFQYIKSCFHQALHSRQLPKGLPLRPVLILLLNVPETLERFSKDLYTLYNFNIYVWNIFWRSLYFCHFKKQVLKIPLYFIIFLETFFFLFRQYLGHVILTFLKEATHLFPLIKNIENVLASMPNVDIKNNYENLFHYLFSFHHRSN